MKIISHLLKGIILTLILSSCGVSRGLQMSESNIESTALLIPLGYPEVIVSTTEAFYSHLLPIIGMGKKGKTRAGHAAMVLVEKEGDQFEFYDLGRYTTPDGYSRVRSQEHDPELEITIKPVWKNNELQNLKEMLLYLKTRDDKTYDVGDIYASVCDKINYVNTKEYLDTMLNREIIRYGPFDRKGSNCARLVSEAIYFGTYDSEVKKKANKSMNFTPNVLANVDSASPDGFYYVVTKDSVRIENKDLNKIAHKHLFYKRKNYPTSTDHGSLLPPEDVKTGESWKWLSGKSSGRWFEVANIKEKNKFEIASYDHKGKLVHKAWYQADKDLELSSDYEFGYPSTYKVITILVGDKQIRLNRIKSKL